MSVKVRKGLRSVLSGGGDIAEGADIIVVSTLRAPPASKGKRASAGQGSAGRNWSVLRSAQNHWPGHEGATLSSFAPSSALCLPGPTLSGK